MYDPQEATFNTNVDPQKKRQMYQTNRTPNITTAKVAENEIIWTGLNLFETITVRNRYRYSFVGLAIRNKR